MSTLDAGGSDVTGDALTFGRVLLRMSEETDADVMELDDCAALHGGKYSPLKEQLSYGHVSALLQECTGWDTQMTSE